MLTETDIDPNMVGKGKISDNNEESKTEQAAGKPNFEVNDIIELWTPLQVACYYGYYKIVAILLTETRTITDFTTSESGKTPLQIAKDFVNTNILSQDQEEENKTGVSHSKCIELLYDTDTLRTKSKSQKQKEKLKKMPRANSAANPLDFFTPTKANSLHQKVTHNSLARNNTVEKNIDAVSIGGSVESCDVDQTEVVLKRVLKPHNLTHIPMEWMEEGYTYYCFNGVIGKQSKVMKKVMDRKIKLDPVEGKLSEYKDVFDYPDKPNRVSYSVIINYLF